MGPGELEDLRYYFEEKEIDVFVAAEESLRGPDLKIQIAKVRRGWSAVRHYGVRKENRNTVSSSAEFDDLLEEGTLRDVKVQFWTRYRMKYPVEVSPSDQLLPRCYRETISASHCLRHMESQYLAPSSHDHREE